MLLPNRLPALLALLLSILAGFDGMDCQAIELRDGVYYPMGGFARVRDGLEKVCRDLGVEFRFNCPVSEVRDLSSKSLFVSSFYCVSISLLTKSHPNICRVQAK